MAASKRTDDVLVTYSLGACIGVSLYDPVARIGGIIHCMLPSSEVDRERAQTCPSMFVDTGVPALLQAMYEMSAERERLVVKVAGAAVLLNTNGLFNIGPRNYAILRGVLEKYHLQIDAESIGGTTPRTLRLHLSNGVTTVKSNGEEVEL